MRRLEEIRKERCWVRRGDAASTVDHTTADNEAHH